ncbi:MAG: hypothetical protein ABIM99_02930 [Candidatus Dojkabacteria bacterium]
MMKFYKNLFKSKANIITFLIAASLLMALYYAALLRVSSFETFIQSNSPAFVILQIVFSILNSVLSALAIVLIIELTRKQKQSGNMNIFQTAISLFISIGTTGCYVCGSILLPSFGIAASFAALPFGGLEIKFITTLLLIYSLNDLQKKVRGICKIYKIKTIQFKYNDEVKFQFNIKEWGNYRPILVTFSFVALIFALPLITSPLGFKINDPKMYSCVHKRMNS